MLNRHLILSTLIIGLLVGMIGSIYDPNLTIFAQQKEIVDNHRERAIINIMDRELKHFNDKLCEIKDEIKRINEKLDEMRGDITNVRVKAAESGGIYGGFASVIVCFSGLLIKWVWNKKKNGK